MLREIQVSSVALKRGPEPIREKLTWSFCLWGQLFLILAVHQALNHLSKSAALALSCADGWISY